MPEPVKIARVAFASEHHLSVKSSINNPGGENAPSGFSSG
jgi:hypothetical protein